MSDVHNGGSAFPRTFDHVYDGMTLRDYFAAKVMQALIRPTMAREDTPAIVSAAAYIMADAMLKERAK